MISQGFPLYGTTEDASAPGVWAVVGWTPVGNSGAFRPVVVPVDGPARNAIVPNDAIAWEFTTTDPTTDPTTEPATSTDPGVDYRADSDRLADLIGRMVLIADRIQLEHCGPGTAAGYIREALRS